MKPRQWILMITLVLSLSVAVGALPQQEQLQPVENGQTTLMAAASAPENLMALVQGAGQDGAATGPPPRPSEAVRAAVATRPPMTRFERRALVVLYCLLTMNSTAPSRLRAAQATARPEGIDSMERRTLGADTTAVLRGSR